VLVHLYGFLQEDFVGRLIIVDDNQPVGALARQLQAWGPDLYPTTSIRDANISNERGALLDPSATILDSGLTPGALFRAGDARL
jgi:hypothetical protein